MNTIYLIAIFALETLKLDLLLFNLLRFEKLKQRKPFIIACISLTVMISTLDLLGCNEEILMAIVGGLAILAIIFKLNKMKKFFLVILGYLTICIIDMVFSAVYALLTEIDTDIIMKSKLLTMITNSFSIVLLLFLIIVFKRTTKNMKFFSWINKKYFVMIFLGLIGVGFYIAPIQVIGLQQYNDKKMLLTVFGISLSGIAFIVLSIALMISYNNKKYYEECYLMNQTLLKQQQEYFTMLIEKETDTKSFRHDIKNHIYCIRELLEQSSGQKAVEYIVDMQQEVERLSVQEQTGNEIINIIINDIFGKAKYNNILLDWKGILPDQLKITDMDLCIIFSNLMKNAVEATEKVVDTRARVVKVNVMHVDMSLHITMINPIVEIINIVNNKLVSIKEDRSKHGFGCQNVESVANKYGGKITYSCTDEFFTAELAFYNII